MELMSSAITTHVYMIFCLVAIIIFNLTTVLFSSDFISMAKKLRFMTPLYHGINATVAYTGAIVSAYVHDLSYTVILMIMVSIFVMVLEIKRYKKMRIIKSDDIQAQYDFKLFARKIYIIEFGALFFVYIIAKIF
jgi:heme A synthase